MFFSDNKGFISTLSNTPLRSCLSGMTAYSPRLLSLTLFVFLETSSYLVSSYTSGVEKYPGLALGHFFSWFLSQFGFHWFRVLPPYVVQQLRYQQSLFLQHLFVLLLVMSIPKICVGFPKSFKKNRVHNPAFISAMIRSSFENKDRSST